MYKLGTLPAGQAHTLILSLSLKPKLRVLILMSSVCRHNYVSIHNLWVSYSLIETKTEAKALKYNIILASHRAGEQQ